MRSHAVLTMLLLPLAALSQDMAGGYVIEGRFDTFTTDEIGNVYALQGDELRLFDARGRSWLNNSTKTFGRIGSIDAFYSLKPMLFAPDQGQIAVLDNTLSLQGSVINLPREGYPQVTAACMSVQNHFWFFDQRELSLVRVDAQLRLQATTGRLDQQLGFAPQPAGMQEHDSRLYVNDPRHGILVLDLFGTYMRTLPILGASTFEVRGTLLWSYSDQGMQVMDVRTFDQQPVELPKDIGPLRDVRVERGMLYALTPDRIIVRPLQGVDR